MNEYWHQTVAELKKQIEDLKKENENLRIDVARLETRAKNSENALKALVEYGT
mgnify:CR=1 FL=1